MPYLSHQPDRLKSTEQRLLENIDKGSEIDTSILTKKKEESVLFKLTLYMMLNLKAYHTHPNI